MRKAYPEVDLPELALSQEEAANKISEYYGKHDYSPGDYDTYSQDPEWRELMQKAYPDTELPSLVDDVKAKRNIETKPAFLGDASIGELANGRIPSSIFSKKHTFKIGAKRLDDFTQKEYEKIIKEDPEKASKLLTAYNNRVIQPDDINKIDRKIVFDNCDRFQVVDKDLSGDSALIKDSVTGMEYKVYPNPMVRMSHFDGGQGQNDIGMRNDCGIASTAKSINDMYGKRVTSENRLAMYAFRTNNCDMQSIATRKWGGTNEPEVVNFYRANGIECESYQRDNVPDLSVLAEALRNGGSSTVAVSSDLLWHYDDAQKFDEETVDFERYAEDAVYAREIDSFMQMKSNAGVFRADHFVNVSNAVYDNNNNLTHFIVSDTGNGTTKIISKEDFQRAYNGQGDIRVRNQGCVIAKRISRR